MRYLSILLDQQLDWSNKLSCTLSKFNRAIGLFSKISHYILKKNTKNTLPLNTTQPRFIKHRRKETVYQKLDALQNKCIRIINFKAPDTPLDELRQSIQILRLFEYIMLIEFLVIKDVLSSNTIEIFQNLFT